MHQPSSFVARKILISAILVLSFGAYSVYARKSISTNLSAVLPIVNSPQENTQPTVPTENNLAPQTTPSLPTSTKSSGTKPTPPAVVPPAQPKPKGQYADGQYTGISEDAYYGNIQVKAVIQNGKITDVIFLDHPHDRSTSVYINSQAMPYLKQEAIAAQSAKVNIISGATDSSIAFRQSLASALAQAKI